MENKNLEWELNWIDTHPQFYIDADHLADVKHNVTVGYEIRALEGKLNALPHSARNPLRLRIAELRDTLRYNSKVEYACIKCPPTPKLDAELDRTTQLKTEYGDKWWMYAVPGQVESTGIRDRVVCTGTRDHSTES